MEISHLNGVEGVSKLSKKGKVAPMQPSDTVHISGAARESVKIDDWIDQLKAMPEIRPEAVARASAEPTSLHALAERLAEELVPSHSNQE